MKKLVTMTVLTTLALVLAACSGAGASAQPAATNADTPSVSNSGATSAAPASGPSGLQLAAGMLKLEGTSNAVTAQEATQLLPLWQALGQLETTAAPQGGPQGAPQGTQGPGTNTAMMQQMAAQIALINNAMTPAQIQAIADMQLSRQDFFTAFQQAGIAMGGPGQGGGFPANGGTFTPPQGTPPADRTPRAFGSGGGFGANGARPGFGSFVPQSVITGIVQFLQKKAGS